MNVAWQKEIIWMAEYVAQNLYVRFSINGAFQDMQVTHGTGTENTPIPSKLLVFEL